MKLQLLYSITAFWLAFVTSHADLSPEVYWKVKLPNTQIPKIIKDFLPRADDDVRELKQDKTITKKKVYYGLHQNGAWVFRPAREDEIRELNPNTPSATMSNNEAKSRDLKDNFLYKPYFLEKDLKKGNIINFPSMRNKNEAPFLPRQIVESIDPFSSQKIPETLNHFSIDSNSKDGQTIEETIKTCEEPAMKGENRLCATSLESMVDFTLSNLKTNNIMAITTEVEGDNQMLQKYTIETVQQIADWDIMICHKMSYAYAVHFCHVGGNTKTFIVSMVGADGAKVKAVSVCHKDTSNWHPKGLPFVVLNVNPGTTTICHFLPDDQIVFLPSKEGSKLS